MTTFEEMDPELVLAAIEGHKDVLAPEAERLEQLYRSLNCPRCNQGLRKEFASNHVFADQNVAVARALLRCAICDYLVNPHDGIVLNVGDPSRIPTPKPDIPYIVPSD